ncbi:MAG: sugar porter family MFS transporter [Planctomycetaceae bacterium]|nr:sugar porter family MFS transporter [Planctomycetaceae bacterium]
MNAIVLRSSLIAALGGLLFGFDTAVISGTTDDLRRVFALGDGALGFTVACALIGTIAGALSAGWPADRWGRRGTLIVVALLYFVSALGSAWPWGWGSLLFFRFLGGIGVGMASVVCPLYIAEIAPASRRGRLVALAQFNVVLGILLAYLSNWLIGAALPGGDGWRWMFGIEAAPAGLFFGLLFLTPESPRWLLTKGRADEARRVLEAVGGEEDLSAIRRSIEDESAGRTESLFSKRYRRPVLLAVAMAAFNQLSGINAIIYYTPDIFRMAGFDRASSLIQSVVIGGTNLALTMTGLSLIDRFGRRTLMLVGSIGYLVSLSATAFSYYSGHGGLLLLGSLVVFIAAHAFGQGAVIWVFLSEIFPNSVRAKGTALGSTVHWIMAAVISWTFPLIAARSGGHTFSAYALCMAGQLVWVLWIMPETKGVPLEAIEQRVLQP